MRHPLLVASFACLLLVLTISTSVANADIAKPKPSAEPSKIVLRRNLDIVPDEKGYRARLLVTQSDLQELRAALDAAAGGSNTGVAASITHSPVRTIVAGLLLFLSVSFAGVWLARNTSSGRARKAVAVGVLVVAVLGAAAIITRGNAGPPPTFYWNQLSKNLDQGRTTSGEMLIEVVPDEPNRTPGIKLVLPYKPKQRGDDE